MTQVDQIVRMGNSTVQHGTVNNRVYLMHCDPSDEADLPKGLVAFARERGYGKVFAKIPRSALPAFHSEAYEMEAEVPGYFRGEEDALFMVCYTDPERRMGDRGEADRIRDLAMSRGRQGSLGACHVECGLFRLTHQEADEAAALYRRVFESYPFPIHDPSYLRRTMDSHVAYYGIREGGSLVALASAEKDSEAQAAELTDFATHPDARGRGMAGQILARMESDLGAEGYRTGYTIARALSAGMNITFARAGYAYGGMLWNNTHIFGRIEPMNVWHKAIRT